MDIDAANHVVISMKSQDSSRKHYHRLSVVNGSFAPACGAAMDVPIIVHRENIPIGGRMTDLQREYARCSRCDWDR